VSEAVAEDDTELPPVRRVRWTHAYRIIPTRFPPVSLFERLGDPAEWEVLAELESLTNPRIRCEIGEIAAVPPGERIAGPGASWVMGPFVHKRPSRFADGSFGAYYCANRRATAVAETCWHMERFYASTAEAALDVDMRVLVGSIDDRFHDLRDREPRWQPLLDPADYTHSRAFARRLRAAGSRGVVYPSVRDDGGLCVGAFTPRAVVPPAPKQVLRYHWDGRRIARVFDFATEQWLDR
jgi:RES domain-containing protein